MKGNEWGTNIVAYFKELAKLKESTTVFKLDS
jgi:hypothetical protein